jgi:hypothetical protein
VKRKIVWADSHAWPAFEDGTIARANFSTAARVVPWWSLCGIEVEGRPNVNQQPQPECQQCRRIVEAIRSGQGRTFEIFSRFGDFEFDEPVVDPLPVVRSEPYRWVPYEWVPRVRDEHKEVVEEALEEEQDVEDEEADEQEEQEQEGDDEDPANETLSFVELDFGAVMTDDGSLYVELGRWGHELQIRMYLPATELSGAEVEVKWSAPVSGTDGEQAGRAALFDVLNQIVDDFELPWVQFDEDIYRAWRNREEAEGRAPWQTGDRTALMSSSTLTKVGSLDPTHMHEILIRETPRDEAERDVWWEVALRLEGFAWPEYGGLERLR